MRKKKAAGRAADVTRKKSKVTVCLEFYLNDLSYHIYPDAELGLFFEVNTLTLTGLHLQ